MADSSILDRKSRTIQARGLKLTWKLTYPEGTDISDIRAALLEAENLVEEDPNQVRLELGQKED